MEEPSPVPHRMTQCDGIFAAAALSRWNATSCWRQAQAENGKGPNMTGHRLHSYSCGYAQSWTEMALCAWFGEYAHPREWHATTHKVGYGDHGAESSGSLADHAVLQHERAPRCPCVSLWTCGGVGVPSSPCFPLLVTEEHHRHRNGHGGAVHVLQWAEALRQAAAPAVGTTHASLSSPRRRWTVRPAVAAGCSST